jgi:adenylate kinase
MSNELKQFSGDPRKRSRIVQVATEPSLHPVMYYTGVSASGKDFLLDKVFENDTISTRVTKTSMGRLMAAKLNTDRDSMIKRDGIDSIRDVQAELIPDLLAVSPTVMNAHLVSKYNGLYIVNPQFEMDLKPQQYVVIYSNPELIKQRRIVRNESGGRQSEVEDEETIDLHQRLAINISRTLADYHGAGLTVIYNGITNVDENVELLKDRISALA